MSCRHKYDFPQDAFLFSKTGVSNRTHRKANDRTGSVHQPPIKQTAQTERTTWRVKTPKHQLPFMTQNTCYDGHSCNTSKSRCTPLQLFESGYPVWPILLLTPMMNSIRTTNSVSLILHWFVWPCLRHVGGTLCVGGKALLTRFNLSLSAQRVLTPTFSAV